MHLPDASAVQKWQSWLCVPAEPISQRRMVPRPPDQRQYVMSIFVHLWVTLNPCWISPSQQIKQKNIRKSRGGQHGIGLENKEGLEEILPSKTRKGMWIPVRKTKPQIRKQKAGISLSLNWTQKDKELYITATAKPPVEQSLAIITWQTANTDFCISAPWRADALTLPESGRRHLSWKHRSRMHERQTFSEVQLPFPFISSRTFPACSSLAFFSLKQPHSFILGGGGSWTSGGYKE